ncbi:MAG: RNA polymerase sigma factor, partial [Phycisphaerales bacterium JB039]
PVEAPPIETAGNEEALAAADAAILALPQAQREVVGLRLFASLGYAEIAAVLGVGESTARSHMSLALRALRRDLASWVEDAAGASPKETTDDRAQAR